MLNRFFLIFALVAAAWHSTFDARISWAKDYFLTIGGGPSVESNQLSIERNVSFQQSVLAHLRPDKPSYDVWFADGSDPRPDVQCRDPQFERKCPAARRLLAEVLGDADSMDLVYRNNQVKELKGPSDLKLVKDRFRDLASDLKSGDRVVVYMTGHGGSAGKAEGGRRRVRASNPYNTTFYCWNAEPVTATEFTSWLDRFPRDVQVVLVMVQCYAGGFAHTIFQQANAKLGLAPYERCGFFAQLHDRGAAGCTPDANEADYEEYSGCFWTALLGKSRAGKTLSSADYDKNGHVSFAEAHAYAIIESDTIDVPVRTSGALLRQYSRAGKPIEKKEAVADSGDDSKTNEIEFAELTGPIAKLSAISRADQRAILEQLPAKLALGAQPTVEDIRQKMQQIGVKLSVAEAKLGAATRERRAALKRARQEIYEIWPELKADYAPLAIELATDRADEFVKRVETRPGYKAFHSARAEEKESEKQALTLERAKARSERLLQTCEDVVLAANLPRVAPPEVVTSYKRLVALEESTLADSSHGESPPESRTTASAGQ
jgi:hypothetical protein